MAKFSSQNITELKSKLSSGARIVLEGDADYKKSLIRWSAACEQPAAIIVFPTTAAEVAEALQFARSHNLEIAVRGGGHWVNFSSSTDGGLCIDLSSMRKITVDTNKRTIRAAGGALWRDVYAAGQEHGLACVGGAHDQIGVGGLTLGGGYGYMSGAHGLVIDNLLEVEYVLADGSIVVASEQENSDLFWAARGAGASFGVATSFLYQAHKQEAPVWGGLIAYTSEKLNEVIEAANHFMELEEERGSLVISVSKPSPSYTTIVVARVYYNGTASEAQKTFGKLLQIKSIANTTGLMSYPDVNKLVEVNPKNGEMRFSMKGAAFQYPLSTSFAGKLVEKLTSFVDNVPDASSSLISFEFFPYSKITSVSQNATAFANRGAYGNLLSTIGWRDQNNDTQCHETARLISAIARSEFLSQQEKLGIKKNDTERGVGEYFNYDGLATSGEYIFGANLPRLVELKKRYDPENLFSKGPKLFSA